MGLVSLDVKEAQGLCPGSKPWGKVCLEGLSGFRFTCPKPTPTKCVHLDAVWDVWLSTEQICIITLYVASAKLPLPNRKLPDLSALISLADEHFSG